MKHVGHVHHTHRTYNVLRRARYAKHNMYGAELYVGTEFQVRLVADSRLVCGDPPVSQPAWAWVLSVVRICSSRSLTYHDASRHGIPLQPEGNEGRGHQYDARNEHRGKVERPVTGKHEVYFQATVITYMFVVFVPPHGWWWWWGCDLFFNCRQVICDLGIPVKCFVFFWCVVRR